MGKGKGCYTLIQGVTAPLNCRVFNNPRSYVLISSSIPLCHLQLSDKRMLAAWLGCVLVSLDGWDGGLPLLCGFAVGGEECLRYLDWCPAFCESDGSMVRSP